MPNISEKALQMPASPIRKLVPFSDEAKKKGIHVFHLNIGQPDIETPSSLLNAVKETKIRVLEYSPSPGIESYRIGLAKYYASHEIHVSSNEILVTTGGSEALQFAFHICFNPRDEVIIPEPFYANYNGFSAAGHVHVVPISSQIETGFRLPSLSDFEKAITPKTKGILICNPGNPTGCLYSREELQGLGELAKKHNLFLLADEVYREFCYDGKKFFSVMHLKNLDDNIILLDSISKRYSACGARIGALITRNKEVLSAALRFAQARLSPPTLGQIAGEGALSTPPSYFEAVIKEYSARRNFLVEALNQIPGVFCNMPGGAFYCIARLPVLDTDHFCEWLLKDFSYLNQTVMLAPASGFYASPKKGKNEVRLAYVLKISELEMAMVCLKKGLETYQCLFPEPKNSELSKTGHS